MMAHAGLPMGQAIILGGKASIGAVEGLQGQCRAISEISPVRDMSARGSQDVIRNMLVLAHQTRLIRMWLVVMCSLLSS
jgi:hypothetical protein